MPAIVTRTLLGAASAAILAAIATVASAQQVLIIGNDNKSQGLGKDQIQIFDIADPANPKLSVSLALENSLSGPPTNMAVVPGNQIALVANSIHATEEAGRRVQNPGNQLYVIDLTARPPALLATIETGKQPSGLAVSPKGDLAMVTFRNDNAIGVFSIAGKEVKLIDTIAMGDAVSAVTFTPDGKHALAAKVNVSKIAWLDIDGTKVTYNKYDMTVGVWPYNVVASPKGEIALVANTSNNGGADGGVDTVAVIDLTATPARVIDYVTAGDAPEGLAFSPAGDYAVVAIQNGGNARPDAFYFHKNGLVQLLRVDGKKVTRVGEAEVGGFPEGIAVSPNGKYVYVGGNVSNDLAVLEVNGNTIKEIGTRISLPGQMPASMAASPK